MRTLLRSALMVGMAMGIMPAIAAADPITATITFVGTGSLGSTVFTDSLVTVAAHFTTESLHGCDLDPSLDCSPGGPPLFGPEAPVISVTVGGATGSRQGGAGVSVQPGLLEIGDVEGRLGFSVVSPEITAASVLQAFGPVTGTIPEDELGDNCIEKIQGYCPVLFYTDAGPLELTSVEGTSTGQVVVGSNAAVPEPGTWVMAGTGLVSGLGAVRRWLGARSVL